jgi:asparagine synthase (glutamine-hydrolysing)
VGSAPAVGAPGRTIPQPADDLLTVAALEMVWYMQNQFLRLADWAGRAHALEIRVGRVEITLRRRIAPLLATKHRPTKLKMAGTLATPLPVEVIPRPKSGFLLPVWRWLAAASGQGGGRGDYDWRIWAQAVHQHHTGTL